MTTKNDCCGEKTFPIPKPQGDDLDEARLNPYRKSDYYFEQILSYEDPKGLRIYHENNQEVVSVCIDYYRKINRIEATSLVEDSKNIYRDWNGELIVNDVDFEIDSTYLNRKVTDIAVYLMLNSDKDINAGSNKVREILSLNQIHN